MKNLPFLRLGSLILALFLGSFGLSAQDVNTNQAPVNAQVSTNESSYTGVIQATEGERPEPDAKTTSKGKHQRDALVVIGQGAELKAGEVAAAMVVIGGDGIVRGEVQDAAVVVGGDLEVEGIVDDAAVAVMGSIKVKSGAHIRGDVVAVGGKVEIEEGAKVDGHTQEVGFGMPDVQWLQAWFKQCVLKMRPLAPQVGWVWIIAGVFFILYLFIALVFPRPVSACIDELNRRPATTFLLGILTKLIVPLIFMILVATGIGVFVIPFIIAALLLGAIVGKVAIIEWLGLRVKPSLKPVLAFLVGFLMLTILYMIPFLGLIMYGITSLWGLGAAVGATFGGLRRELPERPAGSKAPLAPMPAPAGSAHAYSTPAPGASFTAPPAADAATAGSAGQAGADPIAPPFVPPVVPDALTYPRATFWERAGAGFIDIILVSILSIMVGGPPLGFLLGFAYFIALWAWKGTTVGGIILNLRVVRSDGQKISVPVAIVRALTGAFGLMTLLLGFIWIAWDSERQAWQDKVAGTVVVRTPKGIPLLLL